MKVAVLIDTWFPHIGGGQINSLEISKKLALNGIHVEIITRDNGKDNLKLSNNIKVIKLGSYKKPHDQISQIIFCIKAFFYVFKKEYSLVHAHAFWPGLTARLLMVTKGIPAVFTVHGTSINTSLLNPLARRVEKFILNEILYTVQTTVSRDFLKIKNINKKIVYIPNGINIQEFETPQRSDSNAKTLIFVGRLHPQKNLINLIKAIKIVIGQNTTNLVIVGNGPQRKDLEKIIRLESLTKNVKLLGEIPQRNLKQYYSRSHLFILPSLYEGFPLTLLEAWASKLPVITSMTGESQFLVKNGQNGYLINDAYSPQEIAKTINKALENRNLAKLGLAGYNLVKSQYTWDKAAQETLKVYENVLKSQN